MSIVPQVQIVGPDGVTVISSLGGGGSASVDFTGTNNRLDTANAKLGTLAAQEARNRPARKNYYAAARDGSNPQALTTLGAGIVRVCVTAVGSDVWYDLGTSNAVRALTPGADITDGTAPTFVPRGASITQNVEANTYIALNGTGISLEGWTS